MARLFLVEPFFYKKFYKKKEREGFEPSIVCKNYAGFQDRSHKPLGHLSYFLSKKNKVINYLII